MSTKKCIVCQCRVIHEKSSDKENGITLFGVPKNIVEKWKDAIPYLLTSFWWVRYWKVKGDFKCFLPIFKMATKAWFISQANVTRQWLSPRINKETGRRKWSNCKKVCIKKKKVLTDLVPNPGKQSNVARSCHQTFGNQNKYQSVWVIIILVSKLRQN